MPVRLVPEELLITRQAFPEAQRLLQGSSAAVPGAFDAGWHDTTISRESGATARVTPDGALADLVGEILRIRYGLKDAYVYCEGSSAALATDLSLHRRAFLALAPLYKTTIPVIVEVVA